MTWRACETSMYWADSARVASSASRHAICESDGLQECLEMANLIRRTLGDAVISMTALIFLILMLVSIDDRVRDRVSGFWGTPSSSEIVGASREVGSLVSVVFEAVKDQSVAHAPLAIFALAATVLVLFMVRT
jgi:hypothetical protein